LDELVAFARAHHIKPYHHAHLWTMIETVRDAERLLARSPDLYLLLDTGHLLAGRSDPMDVFRSEILRQRIGHVHLKDFSADAPPTWDHHTQEFWKKGRFAELGGGNMGLDVRAILQGLEEVGYDGWVSVELDRPFPARTPADAARANRDYLRSLGY
jgi:inosose dehydratase